MRLSLLAVPLFLAACGPAAPPPQPLPDATGLPMANGEPSVVDNTALLAAAPAEGQWRYDDRSDTAIFGPTDSEYVFKAACSASTGHIRLILRLEDALPSFTFLRILTVDRTHEFEARSFDGNVPNVSAGMNGSETRLADLARTQERFAVQFEDARMVIPWDPSIARALNRCAAVFGAGPWQ